ncbi:MAG: CDGSH iron-sulfur domain-containing protein [Xanthomonadales bacterium]|nr:CDGSH iron-sulfur domain-containing protein [Xanthomonadales bacterium]
MDDTTKAAAMAVRGVDQHSAARKSEFGNSEAKSTFVAYMDDYSRPAEASRPKGLTHSAKALDRWFAERQKQHGPPRLLEIPNEALITGAGPINLTGNITLVKEDGSIVYANHLSLCRCGGSSTKPICDEHHLIVEFLHSGRIYEASDVQHSERSSKLTIAIIKNGPVTFSGRLRLHNSHGQECVKQRGSLCRCGHSANKPFCDGSHEKTGFRSGS